MAVEADVANCRRKVDILLVVVGTVNKLEGHDHVSRSDA